MSTQPAPLTQPAPSSWTLPLYFGWVNVGLAALAMVGTLPGRTQGLGLITEPLLADLGLDRILFARLNLWATLIGALFALGVGRLIDRFGSRVVLTAVAGLLGLVVVAMSGASSFVALMVWVTLTRGLGQSALSVVSITLVGQWFVRRLSLAMAVYSVVLSIGFMVAFPLVGAAVLADGWRSAWAGVGWVLLLGLSPLCLLFVRRAPEASGLVAHPELLTPLGQPETAAQGCDHTLGQALKTPAFWVFGLAAAVYLLTASGIALFNESILAERGFDAATYHRTLAITALTSLAGNFLGGWLASRGELRRLMAVAMGILAVTLAALPHVATPTHVVLWAVGMGLAGGCVMVVFFAVWPRVFGRSHLGQIQGAAQALTVVASAVGPLLLAECVTRTGSYALMFRLLAGGVAGLAAAAWFVGLPRRSEAPVGSVAQ